MPKLIIKQGDQVRELDLTKENFSIGRTPDNDLELKDSLISRRHSSVVKKGERFMVYDLGSSNGTYVNQEKIDVRVLDDGDVIRLGETEITFRDESGKSGPPENSTPTPARPQERAAGGPLGSKYIVQHVDEIAESYLFDITEALQRGVSIVDARKEVPTEKAARESNMFFILYQVGKALSTAPTLEQMLETSMRLIFEVINCERGVLMMIQNGREENLAPRFAYHRQRGVIPAADIPISTTIANQVVKEKSSIITSDALQDPRFMQGMSIVQYNIRSALCVPIWEQKRVYGAIYLDNLAKTYAFTKDDLELLTAIANLIAIRLKQEELNEKLRRETVVRENLSKYHSPDVVEMIMSHGGDLGLTVREREVTVLFADVVASTRLAEQRRPEEVAALLNDFFDLATTAVFSAKGSVNNFIGDEVMAIFNAPLDHSGHATAAVDTALAIRRGIDRLNERFPERQFHVRIGINSGHALAGNIGARTRMQYTVIGDVVNVAKRLCSLPEVDRIVVGEETYRYVKDGYQTRCLGELPLKGKENPLLSYEILP